MRLFKKTRYHIASARHYAIYTEKRLYYTRFLCIMVYIGKADELELVGFAIQNGGLFYEGS